MTIFKHSKQIQKEFERLDTMINYKPLTKPTKANKLYTGSFEDKDGNTIVIENGQVKSTKSA